MPFPCLLSAIRRRTRSQPCSIAVALLEEEEEIDRKREQTGPDQNQTLSLSPYTHMGSIVAVETENDNDAVISRESDRACKHDDVPPKYKYTRLAGWPGGGRGLR